MNKKAKAFLCLDDSCNDLKISDICHLSPCDLNKEQLSELRNSKTDQSIKISTTCHKLQDNLYELPVELTVSYHRVSDSLIANIKIIDEPSILEKEQAYKNAIIENSNDGIITKDLNGKIQSWNKGATAIFGYSEEEMIGESILKLLPKERLEEEKMILEKLRSKEKITYFETIRKHKNGSQLNVSVSISPIVVNGIVIGASKIVRNISPQVETQKALKANRDQYQLLVESSIGVVSQHDPSGIFTYVSGSSLNVYGYSPEELIGKNPYDFFHEEDKKMIWEKSHSKVLKGKVIENLIYRFKKKDGHYIWMNSATKPILSKEGEIEMLFSHTQNIDELVKAQQSLVQSQRMLYDIANTIPGVILRFQTFRNREIKIDFVSNGCFGLWELSKKEIINHPQKIFESIHSDDIEKVITIINESENTSHDWQVEYRNRMNDGTIKWIRLSGIPFRTTADLLNWHCVALDVTDVKIAENEKEESLIHLRNVLEEKDILLRELHHRVKNNLQLINSLLAIKLFDENNHSIKSFIKDTTHRISTISQIHEQLLNLGHTRDVNLKDYIVKLVSDLVKLYSTDKYEFVFKYKIQTIELPIDNVLSLGLIINELVLNIIKYAYKDEAKRMIFIEIKKDKMLRMIVQDEGIGMNSINISEMNSFGLKIVKMLTEDLQGDLNISNSNGTKYEFNIAK